MKFWKFREETTFPERSNVSPSLYLLSNICSRTIALTICDIADRVVLFFDTTLHFVFLAFSSKLIASLFSVTAEISAWRPSSESAIQTVNLPIFNTLPFQPVYVMQKYLATRSNQGTGPQSPLFPENEHSSYPLSRTTFTALLKQSLNAVGLTDYHFCGHSFRIGACTSGAAAGVPDHLLQTLGRWQSTCYTRYIPTSQIQLPRLNNF